MTPEAMREVVDEYISAYNAFDIAGMLSLLHEDVEFRNLSGGEVNATATGKQEFRALAEQGAALFSEREQTITAFTPQADTANAEIEYKAVLAADLPNGLKKGEKLELRGRSEFVFRDGCILKITDIS